MQADMRAYYEFGRYEFLGRRLFYNLLKRSIRDPLLRRILASTSVLLTKVRE